MNRKIIKNSQTNKESKIKKLFEDKFLYSDTLSATAGKFLLAALAAVLPWLLDPPRLICSLL